MKPMEQGNKPAAAGMDHGGGDQFTFEGVPMTSMPETQRPDGPQGEKTE